MKILCVGYREWSLSIYDRLKKNPAHQYYIIRSEGDYNPKIINDFQPNIILFYGWSKIVSTDIVKNYDCIMLHPSPLPKYRGGSPIQNQIINGEEISAVSLFLMDEGLDDGPILKQKIYSLDGNLADILNRITNIGYELTMEILEEGLNPVKQNHAEATIFKRRRPEESEITLEELKNKPAKYLYNKIRMLQDPYPNAFIKTSDEKFLFISMAQFED
jgi:methionyl-tRNA formyltransferase